MRAATFVGTNTSQYNCPTLAIKYTAMEADSVAPGLARHS